MTGSKPPIAAYLGDGLDGAAAAAVVGPPAQLDPLGQADDRHQAEGSRIAPGPRGDDDQAERCAGSDPAQAARAAATSRRAGARAAARTRHASRDGSACHRVTGAAGSTTPPDVRLLERRAPLEIGPSGPIQLPVDR